MWVPSSAPLSVIKRGFCCTYCLFQINVTIWRIQQTNGNSLLSTMSETHHLGGRYGTSSWEKSLKKPVFEFWPFLNVKKKTLSAQNCPSKALLAKILIQTRGTSKFGQPWQEGISFFIMLGKIYSCLYYSLLQLQWKQDLDKGLDLIGKAIEIDNKCDFAYETMGTIEVQR